MKIKQKGLNASHIFIKHPFHTVQSPLYPPAVNCHKLDFLSAALRSPRREPRTTRAGGDQTPRAEPRTVTQGPSGSIPSAALDRQELP